MGSVKQWQSSIFCAALLSTTLPAYSADFSSMQMQGVEQITVDVEVQAAAERLSKAVQFPTISNQDRNDFDADAL